MTTTDRIDHTAARSGPGRATLAFIGGVAVGLMLGIVLGLAAGGGLGFKSKWTDAGAVFANLPGGGQLGPLPQTFTLPGSSYDYGGVGAALSPAVVDAPSIVKVEVKAEAGRVGVSLARPDGGEVVSHEAVVAPQQGKVELYFRTAPGMGPVVLLLRSADNVPAGASARVTKVQAARQGDIGRGEMDRINKAGLY